MDPDSTSAVFPYPEEYVPYGHSDTFSYQNYLSEDYQRLDSEPQAYVMDTSLMEISQLPMPAPFLMEAEDGAAEALARARTTELQAQAIAEAEAFAAEAQAMEARAMEAQATNEQAIPGPSMPLVPNAIHWQSVRDYTGDQPEDYARKAEEAHDEKRPDDLILGKELSWDHSSYPPMGGLDGVSTRTLKYRNEQIKVYQRLEAYKRSIGIRYRICSDNELEILFQCFLKSIYPKVIGNVGRSRINTRTVRLGPGDTAIVLLILALGEVCLQKGIVDYPRKEYFGPIAGDASHEKPKNSRASGFNLKSAQKELEAQTKLNNGSVPGREYFAKGLNLAKHELRGKTLRGAQLKILISLYFGQMVQIKQCQVYLEAAGRTLQFLLQGQRPEFFAKKGEAKTCLGKENRLVFTFWTCYQLESIHVAEMRLPSFNLREMAQNMPHPSRIAAKMSIDDFRGYMQQINIRNLINDTVVSLYAYGREDTYKLPVLPEIESELHVSIKNLADGYARAREAESHQYMFSEEDSTLSLATWSQTSVDYYFVQSLMYRPYLQMVMNRDRLLPHEQISEKILEGAKLCLTTIESSMDTFNAVELGQGRLNCNVWDVAHTQFQNASILLIASKDQLLQKCIDQKALTVNVTHFLRFLQLIVPLSPSMWEDLRILELIGLRTAFLEYPFTEMSAAQSVFWEIQARARGYISNSNSLEDVRRTVVTQEQWEEVAPGVILS